MEQPPSDQVRHPDRILDSFSKGAVRRIRSNDKCLMRRSSEIGTPIQQADLFTQFSLIEPIVITLANCNVLPGASGKRSSEIGHDTVITIARQQPNAQITSSILFANSTGSVSPLIFTDYQFQIKINALL